MEICEAAQETAVVMELAALEMCDSTMRPVSDECGYEAQGAGGRSVPYEACETYDGSIFWWSLTSHPVCLIGML